MAETTRVQHPVFSDVTYEVPLSAQGDWLQQGYKPVPVDEPDGQPEEGSEPTGVTGQPTADEAPTAADAPKPAQGA